MSLGKGEAKTQVTDYRLSVHYGVCLGRVDKIKEIIIGDKPLGIEPITSNATLDVDRDDLFGGPKTGGGVRGRIWPLLGGDTQVLPEFLAAKMGRTSATVTGFRGFLSIFFTGKDDTRGFMWGSNNPVVPAVDVTVERAPKGLAGDAMIGSDANPAHMIYEVMTDQELGGAYTPDDINTATFLSVAQKLRDESFGLSMIWSESTPSDTFIYEILSHIKGDLVYDLASGKWELSLLRADYGTANLREINPTNANLISFQRKGWGESVNEVVVTWTNPINEETETVTRQDNAGLFIQSSVSSDMSPSYLGVRRQGMALQLAERDLRQAAAPLASVEVEVDRSLWDLKAGNVIRFNWYELDRNGKPFHPPTVMRVLKVGRGKKGSPRILISLIEDIFAFTGAVSQEQPGQFVSPSQAPADIPYFYANSAPYFFLANQYGDTLAKAMTFPETRAAILLSSDLTDIREIDVLSKVANSAGVLEYREVETVDFLDTFNLVAAIGQEKETTLALPAGINGFNIGVGTFLLVESNGDEEIMLVRTVATDSIFVSRGSLDTVPLTRVAGSRVWVIPVGKRVFDPTTRAASETATYKFLPKTSKGRLREGLATERNIVLSDRLQRPLRPTNIKINGQEIPTATLPASTATFTFTWSLRNRLTETSQPLRWDSLGVTPEPGQTTAYRVLNGSTVVKAATGLTGSSVVLTKAEMGNPVAGAILVVEFYSVVDNAESWKRSRIRLVIT